MRFSEERKQRMFQHACLVTDALLAFFAYLFAALVCTAFSGHSAPACLTGRRLMISAVVFGVCNCVLQYVFGMYRTDLHFSHRRTIKSVAGLNFMLIVSWVVALYYLRAAGFLRGVPPVLWVSVSFVQIIRRFLARRLSRYLFGGNVRQKHIILVGNGPLAQQFVRDMQKHPERGLILHGYLGPAHVEWMGRYFGRYENLGALLADYPDDTLVVALEAYESRYMADVLSVAERECARLYLIPFYSNAIPARSTVQPLGRTKLINMRTVSLDQSGRALIKRMMDVFLSLLLILLTSPLMLLTALCVRLSSRGPILFRQERVGKDKKPFLMYKFRSMRETGTEKTGWSAQGDPRRTRFGSFIRRYSIDELPQLFNVLKGDMSLVGPRPEIPYHVNHFKNEISLYLLRQQVKPGMTGWAQVHGLRGDTSIQARVKYDLWYIENWSILLDVVILIRTAFGGIVNHEEAPVRVRPRKKRWR